MDAVDLNAIPVNANSNLRPTWFPWGARTSLYNRDERLSALLSLRQPESNGQMPKRDG
jgi:hypothetical protein